MFDFITPDNAVKISAIASIVSAGAAVLTVLSVYFLYRQLKESRQWNKLHFTYTFFPNPLEFEALEVFLDERVRFWLRDSPLSRVEVKALLGKDALTDDEEKELKESFSKTLQAKPGLNVAPELYEAGRKLKLYLNQIEGYCAAISAGVIDSDSAKHLFAYKFKRAYDKSLPWIDAARTMKNEPSLYIETKKILDVWFPPKTGQNSKY